MSAGSRFVVVHRGRGILLATLVMAAAPVAARGDFVTFRSGNWFPSAGDHEGSNIWLAAPPGVAPGLPGSQDTVTLRHEAVLRNLAGDIMPDSETFAEIGILYLEPDGILNITPPFRLETVGLSVWTGGTVYTGHSVNDEVSLGNRGITTIAGVIDSTIHRTHIENTNRINLVDVADLAITAGGILTNLSGVPADPSAAVIDFQSDADIIFATGGAGSGAQLVNRGVIRKTAGTSTSTIGVTLKNHGAAPNNQSGRIEVLSGNLVSTSDSEFTSGHFHVAPGSSFDFAGDHASLTGTLTGSGGGQVRLVAGGRADAILGATQGVTLNFPAGMFRWTGGTLGGGTSSQDGFIDNVGHITIEGADPKTAARWIRNSNLITHSATGNLHVEEQDALQNLAGGTYDIQSDGGMTGSRVINAGTLRKSQGAGTSYLNVTSVDNTGTVEALSGTLRINRVQQFFSPSATVLSGGKWVVGPGATLQIDTGNTILVNQGDVTLSGPGSTFAKFDTLADNQGIFSINQGRDFTTVGPLANSGKITVGAGSTLTVTGTLTQTGAGEIGGSGNVVAALLLNEGTVSPGASPGLLSVAGNYTQPAAGTLEIEVGGNAAGTQFDVLQVSGVATLGGTLDVSLIDGFAPLLGDQFTFLTAGQVLGQFSLDGPLHNGSPVFHVLYGPTSVTLVALQSVPEPASAVTLGLAASAALLRRRR